jgi:hypothetical protein
MSLKDIAELDVVGAIKSSLDNLTGPPMTTAFVSDRTVTHSLEEMISPRLNDGIEGICHVLISRLLFLTSAILLGPFSRTPLWRTNLWT